MPGTVTFLAAFGNEDRQVELTYLIGGYYHIYIDRYYYGQIINRNGKWTVLLQHPDELDLTTDDIQILTDMIAQHETTD